MVNVEYKSLEKYPEIGKHTPEARIVEGSKENTDSGLKTGMVMSYLCKQPICFIGDIKSLFYYRGLIRAVMISGSTSSYSYYTLLYLSNSPHGVSTNCQLHPSPTINTTKTRSLMGRRGKIRRLDIPLKIHSAAMRATRVKNEFKKSILSCKYLVALNSNAFLNERPGSCSL